MLLAFIWLRKQARIPCRCAHLNSTSLRRSEQDTRMVSHLGLSGSTSSVDAYLTSVGGAGA